MPAQRMSLSKGWFKTRAEEEMEVKGYATVAGRPAASELKSTVTLKRSLTVQHSTQYISLPDFRHLGNSRARFGIQSMSSLVNSFSVVTQLSVSWCHGYQDANWTPSSYRTFSLKPNCVAQILSVSSKDPAPARGASSRASEGLGGAGGNIEPSGHVGALTVSSLVPGVFQSPLVSCSTAAWRHVQRRLSQEPRWASTSIWVVTHQRRS